MSTDPATTRADTGVRPFAVVGAAGVIGGGLLAAVTAHNTSRDIAWATAYLVLVVGAAQIALGTGQARLAASTPPRGVLIAQTILWNAGSVGVLTGTILHTPVLVDLGGVLLLSVLAVFARRVRRGRTSRRRGAHAYHLLILVLAASVLIGIVLAHTTP